MNGASLRTCESLEIVTSTGFFVARSRTVNVPAAASIEEIVPEMLRNSPVTISSAENEVPSAPMVPRART